MKRVFKVEDTDRARSASHSTENGGGNSSSSNWRLGDKTSPAKSAAKSSSNSGVFNAADMIGEGGLGKVYKGRLDSGEISFCTWVEGELYRQVNACFTSVLAVLLSESLVKNNSSIQVS